MLLRFPTVPTVFSLVIRIDVLIESKWLKSNANFFTAAKQHVPDPETWHR